VAARLLPLLLLVGVLTACGFSFEGEGMTIDAESTENREILGLYSLVFWLATAVFVLVEAFLLYALFRYRRRPGDRLPRQIHGNNTLELAWTVAPFLMLILVAVPTLRIIVNQSSPAPADAVRITVIGHQFWWEVQYPDLGVTTANEIHVPVGRTAAFTLTSADVQHAFWVPKLGGKVDLYPNRQNTLTYTPTEMGNYFGQCSELCGTAHAYMKMRLISESQGDFDAWVAAQRGVPPTAQNAQEQRIREGEQVFTNSGCVACHYIEGVAQGRNGPNLTHLGSRTTIAAGWIPNNTDNLKRWIRHPGAIKPGTKMPAFGEDLTAQDLKSLDPSVREQAIILTEDDLDKLVLYLQSLR
jgi:cytochrome c oxidase subunit 2